MVNWHSRVHCWLSRGGEGGSKPGCCFFGWCWAAHQGPVQSASSQARLESDLGREFLVPGQPQTLMARSWGCLLKPVDKCSLISMKGQRAGFSICRASMSSQYPRAEAGSGGGFFALTVQQ